MLMSLIDRNQFECVKVDFPFLHMHHHIELMLGKSLLRVIYSPAVGVLFQAHGSSCAQMQGLFGRLWYCVHLEN